MKHLIIALLLMSSFRTVSQEPVFATIAGGDLYSFDLNTCTRTFIGSTGQGFGDIAFTPNGELWGIVSGNLYHIDPTTANATLVGNAGVGGVSLVGLNDTTLFTESGMKLYGINTNSADTFLIDWIGHSAAGDLTWYDDDLFMVTSGGQIIRITFDNAYASIINVTPIGASIPTCEGAVTSTFIGDYNSIVGFNGPNLIKICQIDGTFEVLCPALNIGGTPGAASIKLAIQNPMPNTCITTSVPETLTKSDFVIFPNPANTFIKISTSLQGRFSYSIYDAMGRIVQSGTCDNDFTIPIENLSSGMHSIEVKAGQDSTRQHLMIIK